MKTKIKNLLKYLGIFSLVATVPLFSALSCGSSSEFKPATDNKEALIDEKASAQDPAPKTNIGNVVFDPFSSLSVSDENLNFTKTVFITDMGNVQDKSFNQSSYEGYQYLRRAFGLKSFAPIQNTSSTAGANLDDFYDKALKDGYKIWVVCGFQHSTAIKSFYNKKNLKDKGIVVVGIDVDLNSDENVKGSIVPGIPQGYSISLQYKTQEGGYVVGYAAASYLAEKYKDKAEQRILNTFGGAAFQGVTDFIYGFLKGIYKYNVDEKNDKKVSLYPKSKVDLNSGFISGPVLSGVVESQLSGKAKIYFPVAGPGTSVLLGLLSKKTDQKDSLVIGVDVNQSVSLSDYVGRFFSSVEKKIGQSVYDVLKFLYSGQTKIEALKTFKKGEKSVVIQGDLTNGLVGYSEPTNKDETDRKNIKKYLEAAKTLFEQEEKPFEDYSDYVKGTQKFLDSLVVKINAITDKKISEKAATETATKPAEKSS